MNIKRRTLLIGLGGTGCFALRSAKKNLQDAELIPSDDFSDETNNSKLRAQIQNIPVRFLAIDLDERSEKERAPFYADIGNDFLLIDKLKIEQKVKYLDLHENRSYWSWYPDKDRNYIKLKQAQYGAGQWRPLGRLAYCEDQNFIESRIYDALQELSAIPVSKDMDTKDIEVCILSSTAGGTGSGMLLDIAYYLQKSQVLQDDNIRVTTYAFLLLPDIFEKLDHAHRTKPNTYASLKELHGFYRQDTDFDMFYPSRMELFKVEAGKSVPFSNIYLINKDLSEIELTSPEDCFKYIGSIVYLRMISELSSQAKSSFANERVPPKIKGMEDDLIQSGYVFSSCSGGIVQFPPPEKLAHTLLMNHIDAHQDGNKGQQDSDLQKWKSTDWHKKFDEIILPWQSKGIEDFWTGFKEKISQSTKEVFDHIENGKFRLPQNFVNNHFLDWEKELEKKMNDEINEGTNTLLRHLNIKNIFENINQTNSSVSTELLLDVLKEIRNSLYTLTADPPQKKETEYNPIDFTKQVHDIQDDIRHYLGNINLLSRWLFFHNSYIKSNIDSVSEKIDTLKDLLSQQDKIAETDSQMAAALKAIIAEKTVKNLGTRLDALTINITRIEETLKLLQKGLKKHGDEKQANEHQIEKHQDEKLINKLSISTSTILDAVKIDSHFLDSLFNKTVNKRLFDSDRDEEEDFNLAESDQSILSPIKIQKNPDPAKIADEITEALEREIANGDIRIDTKKYIKEISTVIGNSYISLFKNLKSDSFAESSIFWSLPEYTEGKKYPFKDENTAIQIKNSVQGLINRTFKGCKQYFTSNTENFFLFYHETHHHPPENIPGIIGYRNDYRTVPFPPEFLHVHKSYADKFGDLIAPELQEAYCGNTGCAFNISQLPHDVNICPSCDNPILNRCGNADPDCDIDNLIERLGGLDQIDKTKITCPGCNRHIKTFWWHCDKHGPQWREKTEMFCPECTTEAEKGNIKFSARTIKEDDKTHPSFCIHCKDTGEIPPFKIPLPDLYFEVPKYKYPLLSKTLQEEDLHNNLCPVCGAQLFPMCPHTDDDIPPHYVERNPEGRLICTYFNGHKETIADIYQCFYCHYPLKADDRLCPRCSKDLVFCTHCSKDKGALIPIDHLLEGNRCPVCKYQIRVKNA